MIQMCTGSTQRVRHDTHTLVERQHLHAVGGKPKWGFHVGREDREGEAEGRERKGSQDFGFVVDGWVGGWVGVSLYERYSSNGSTQHVHDGQPPTGNGKKCRTSIMLLAVRAWPRRVTIITRRLKMCAGVKAYTHAQGRSPDILRARQSSFRSRPVRVDPAQNVQSQVNQSRTITMNVRYKITLATEYRIAT